MNLDAKFGQFFRIHVAAGAGAQEDDVLQPRTVARDGGRQRGVIDDRDPGAVEHVRQLFRRDVGIAMNAHLGIAGFCQSLQNHGQRLIGIDKHSAQIGLRWSVGFVGGYEATPASASTVCIRALAPAVQSAWVASSNSLWLTPSLQGTKIIAAGTTFARLQAS